MSLLTRTQNVISKQKATAKPLTILTLCCGVALVYAASFSSGVYNEYVYNYEVNLQSGPNGFGFKAKARLDILYVDKASKQVATPTSASSTNNRLESNNLVDENTVDDAEYNDSLLVRLRLAEPVFFAAGLNSEPLKIDDKSKKLYSPEHDLYAHIITLSNGTAIVKEIYTHLSDATTFKNIKKSILLNILPTNHHINPQQQLRNKQQQDDYLSLRPICSRHDNNEDQPELFSPDSISHVNIVATPRKSPLESQSTTASNSQKQRVQLPTVFQTVEGYQNVTFRSRVFSQAESNLTTSFKIELLDQIKSDAHEKFDKADSIKRAIDLLDKQKYHVDSIQLERERRVCSTHHCGRTLNQLFEDYRDSLADESLATVDASVAFLRILDKLRNGRNSVGDIMAILKRARANQGVESSVLDILAAARTKESIQASLKHLKLTKSRNLDTAERFLSVLSVAAKTASKMHLKRALESPYYFSKTKPLKRSKEAKENYARLASLEFVAKEFLNMFETTPPNNWALDKLRQSSLLTLATLISANNQENNFENLDDELNLKIEKLLLNELENCDQTDCRVVVLQAIGNVGRLGEAQFQVIKDQVLKFGRRESNSAMKVLRDLLQNQAKDKPLEQSFYKNLKDFLIRIVYDNTQETTSRVLAAELVVRFVPDSRASEEILHHLPSFGNNELATMIYSRMESLRPASLGGHHENWHWKSCITNGSSVSFVKTMASTDSLNASYGVSVELLNKGKLFKESSFDVFLDTKRRTQDLFSLGIFARGLAKFAGGDGDNSEESAEATASPSDEDESAMAGMTLKLLGGNLRPYVFFTGLPDLMGHVLRGTASEPTTVFNGDLLLIDHEEGYPLISGFVAEQQMRGVLSIDVSGKITISYFWNKKSHSVVTTKAAIIVQASQSVYTSYDNLWNSHLFSFGGEALIDFDANVFFSSMPVKTCLQVDQPEFKVRYNSRRHDQTMTDKVRRKITRRTFKVDPKSYSLNSENNKMCSELQTEL